jgi:hypothetical protein
MDGGHREVEVVEVAYGPGGSSSPSHSCPVIAVVVEGTIRTQVKPAKLLAYFVCDHETPVTVVVTE